MVENAEFCDISVHFQYADRAKAKYEPNMHTRRSMLHKTLDAAGPSEVGIYVTASSEPQSAQCMKYEYILAVQVPHQVAACVAECCQPSRKEHRYRHWHFSDYSVCSN